MLNYFRLNDFECRAFVEEIVNATIIGFFRFDQQLYAVRNFCSCSPQRKWNLNTIKPYHAHVKLDELETGWVKSVRGVRQSCTLFPILFRLCTEELAV